MILLASITEISGRKIINIKNILIVEAGGGFSIDSAHDDNFLREKRDTES